MFTWLTCRFVAIVIGHSVSSALPPLSRVAHGASASPGGNGQYSRNEPLSPELRRPDCRHTRAALCHFDLNLSVSRLRRARLVTWLWYRECRSQLPTQPAKPLGDNKWTDCKLRTTSC